MLVCFSAGSSCVLLKCFGHGGCAWPPPVSDAGCGMARCREPMSCLWHWPPASPAAPLWSTLCCGTLGRSLSSQRCLIPAMWLLARGRFWHNTCRHCLYVFPQAHVPMGYLLLKPQAFCCLCARYFQRAAMTIIKVSSSLGQISPAGPLHQLFPLPEGENTVWTWSFLCSWVCLSCGCWNSLQPEWFWGCCWKEWNGKSWGCIGWLGLRNSVWHLLL